jgi:hypothetical protein
MRSRNNKSGRIKAARAYDCVEGSWLACTVVTPGVLVSQVPISPLSLFRLLSELVRLKLGLFPANGLFGYSALIAALRLSHMYRLFDDLSVRSVLSVR